MSGRSSRGFSIISRSRTPTNLDITGITSLHGSKKNLNNTVSTGFPTIKSNLLSSNLVDKKLECEMVYNDYLQTLIKKEIVSNIIKKHDQDLKDQLAIQRDNLHKSKMTLKKLRQEMDCLETLSQVVELVDGLEENINTHSHLITEFDVSDFLRELLELFKLSCNKIYLKDIKSVTDQESLNRLALLLEKCLEVLKRIELSGRPIKEVNELGDLMKKYQLLKNCILQNQSIINKQHNKEAFKLLKTMSDMYALKENYHD